uniref:NADAR family protein n=1 Tax=Agathobacter sp. TaxID=2021311 RepID=UPI004055E90B
MLREKKILPPPWIAFPNIERFSIGWRMGYGEYYMCEWSNWMDTLNEEEETEYKELFPEPITWRGYWDEEWEEAEEGFYYESKKNQYFLPFWRKHGAYKYSLEQVRNDYKKGVKQKYTMFWGHQPSSYGMITKSCFSQWWKSDFRFMGQEYCCMEQLMMANKAELFGDKEIREEILVCQEPKTMKALGRKVRNFNEATWNKVKYSIVLNGNYEKFSQNEELREFLLSTGDDILVEASPFDAIWGIHMSQNDANAQNPLKWRGSNLLGFALMEARDEIRRVRANAQLCDKNAVDNIFA